MAKTRPRLGPYSRALRPGYVDGRTRLGRVLNGTRRDIVAALGGEAKLTPMQRLLVDRVCEKHARCLLLADAMLTATDTTAAFESERRYVMYANSMRHDLAALGLERRASAPSLADALRGSG